jgi:hypothetical protein
MKLPVAHDVCPILRVCLDEVLMAPGKGDRSIIVVVVILERVFVD